MVMPPSRMRLLRKLMTIGAAMAMRDDVTPGRNPLSAPTARVTALSEPPKSVESIALPAEIKGELGSETPPVSLDHETSPDPVGIKFITFCSRFGLSDLLAIPPSTVPSDVCIPLETDCADSPTTWASPPKLRSSSVLNNSVNKAISIPRFLIRLIEPESPFKEDDDHRQWWDGFSPVFESREVTT